MSFNFATHGSTNPLPSTKSEAVGNSSSSCFSFGNSTGTIGPFASPPPAAPAESSSDHHQPDFSGLAPVFSHVSQSFEKMMSEVRCLVMQLESQRQEQANQHQETLTKWMEREERREKARMEHEIRLLEFLSNLTRQQGCVCGGSKTDSEVPSDPAPITEDID